MTLRPCAIILFHFLIAIANGQSKFPCHPGRNSVGAFGCQSATLPSDLCFACPLKKVAVNGDFVNCREIYDIDAPGCKGQLQQYVDMNPCDEKRAAQVSSWSDWDKQYLDYFVYAICEQCCDCIPMGAEQQSYGELASSHSDGNPTLYTPERGNCPAHAYYDICKIFPNIKYLKTPWGPTHDEWPNACPLLGSWFFSPASNNWGSSNTFLDPDVKRFLNNVNVANQCKSAGVWQNCRNMEAAQGRVRR